MIDDIIRLIHAASPGLPTLTKEQMARLKARLAAQPDAPVYYGAEEVRGVGSVWDYTEPADWELWILLRATLDCNQAEIAPAPTQPLPPSKPKVRSDVSLDAQALAVYIEPPDWTKKRIAEHLGTHEKCLAPKRCPKLAAAIAAYKSPLDPGQRRLRGSKDADGNLEAWEEG